MGRSHLSNSPHVGRVRGETEKRAKKDKRLSLVIKWTLALFGFAIVSTLITFSSEKRKETSSFFANSGKSLMCKIHFLKLDARETLTEFPQTFISGFLNKIV